MPAIQQSLASYDLCRRAVAEPDPAQRAEMIAHVRSLIAQERLMPQTPENSSYLVVTEMIMDFLERTLNTRHAATVQ
jgi:hypothetical protein